MNNTFLKEKHSAKTYIDKLYSLGRNMKESTIEFNRRRASSMRVGELSIVGDIEASFKNDDAEIIAEFLVFLWTELFSYFRNSIGLLVEFISFSSDSYMLASGFNKDGLLNRVFISISNKEKYLSDILQNIAHEFLHIDQYLSGGLRITENSTIIYQGKEYPFSGLEEWETFNMQHEKDVYSEEEGIVNLYREDYSNHFFEGNELKNKLLIELQELNIIKGIIL